MHNTFQRTSISTMHSHAHSDGTRQSSRWSPSPCVVCVCVSAPVRRSTFDCLLRLVSNLCRLVHWPAGIRAPFRSCSPHLSASNIRTLSSTLATFVLDLPLPILLCSCHATLSGLAARAKKNEESQDKLTRRHSPSPLPSPLSPHHQISSCWTQPTVCSNSPRKRSEGSPEMALRSTRSSSP